MSEAKEYIIEGEREQGSRTIKLSLVDAETGERLGYTLVSLAFLQSEITALLMSDDAE